MFSDETPNIFHKRCIKNVRIHIFPHSVHAPRFDYLFECFCAISLSRFHILFGLLTMTPTNFVSHINLQLNIIHERINNNCYKIEILSHCKFIRIHSHELDAIYYWWSHRIIMRKLGKFKLHISYTLWQLKHQIEQNVILISEHNNSKCLLKKIVLYLPQKNLLS